MPEVVPAAVASAAAYERQMACFLTRYIGGAKYTEIAALINTSYERARQLSHMGLRRYIRTLVVHHDHEALGRMREEGAFII
jgi:DNA-directed RNA polymerase specialized sigma24 family protein